MSESDSESSSVSERVSKTKHEREDEVDNKAKGLDDVDNDDGDEAIMNDDDDDDNDDGDDAIMNDDDDAEDDDADEENDNDLNDDESQLKPELQLVPTSIAIAVKKEVASRDERRKQFEKKFTEKDEEVILESLIRSGFKSGSKEYWSKVSGYLSLKLSHKSFTYTQVYEKIRGLKKRYLKRYPNPPIGGGFITYGLSHQLWEEDAKLLQRAVKVEDDDDAHVKVKVEEEDDAHAKKKIVVKVEAETDDNKERKRKRKKKKKVAAGEMEAGLEIDPNDNDDGYDVKLEKLVRELQEQDPKFPVALTLDLVPRGSQKRMLQNQWNHLNAQFLTLHRAKAHLTQQTLDALVPSFPSHN